VWSSVALNTPTGIDTNPNAIDPVQIALATPIASPARHR
jgi:hypothetical protein